MKRAVSIGECMVELSGGDDSLYRLGYAGDTFNTAYYLRRCLPAESWSVDYLSAVGDDRYSEGMVAFIAASGVGTGTIARLPGQRPGLYVIHQHNGDRQFTYWRDTAAARHLADDPDALRAGLAGADVLYFSGITLGILAPEARARLFAALGEARQAGARVAFDPNIRPALWPDIAALRSAVMQAAAVASIALPTYGDEAPYFGDPDGEATAARYLAAGAEEVVVKNGADPALVVTRKDREPVAVASVPVDRVVDATGAGDSFNAGYIAARMRGAAPVDAARAGHGVAAQVLGTHGALVPAERFRAVS